MPGVRSTVRVLLGVFALLVTIAWVPATTALAAGGNISIVSAGPDASGDPYDLTVVAADAGGFQIGSVTAHVLSGSADVADVPMTYQAGLSSGASDQVFTPTTAISPSVLQPGTTYTVTVDASDSNGETDTDLAAPGSFTFTYTSTVTATANQQTITQGAQDVTFTGSVTGMAPGGTPTAISGATISVNGVPDPSLVTLADGSFTYTADALTQTTTYTFSVPGTSTYTAGSSNPITITVVPATTTITAQANPTYVTQGQTTVTFTGNVTAGGDPVTNAPVSLAINGGSPSVVTSTDSNGNFQYPFPGSITASASYVFSVSGTSLYSSGQSAPVNVNLDEGTTAIQATASPPVVTGQPQNVTITGAVMVTPYEGAQEPLANVEVYLNGSPIGMTNSLGVFSYPAGLVGTATTYTFSVEGTTYYTGDTDPVTVAVQPATTAISANPPSQSTVTLGSQNVTFSGQVSYTPSGGGTSQGIGQGVPVYMSVNNGTATEVTTTTDASGNYSYTVQGISANSNYTFSVQATALYSQASTSPVSITVNQVSGAVNVKTTPLPPFVTYGSDTVTFNGQATGGTPAVGVGANVPVYLAIGNQPASQVTTTTDAAGDFSFTEPDITASASYTFSVNATNLYNAAQDPVQVNLDQGTTNMTAQSSPPDTDLSATSITLSGTVSVTPYGSTSAVGVPEGTAVYLTTETPQGQTGPTAVTTTKDTNGDFTYTPSSAPTEPTIYDFSVQPGTFYTEASMAVPVGPGLASNLTVTASPASVTEGSQAITFNGTLMGTAPTTGTPAPVAIPDAQVNVTIGTGKSQVAGTTDKNGDFTYTVTGVHSAATYDFSVAATSGYTQATSGVPVVISPALTRITGIKVTPAHLKYGQKATLTGTVQYEAGKTWTALPSTAVRLAEGTAGLGTVKTNAKGDFTASLPTTHGAAWSAVLPSGTLIQQASAVGSLVISVPMKADSFRASLSVSGLVSASGCLAVTAPVGYGPQTSVQIQYATRSRGPWRVLGRLQLHDNLPAGKVGAHYANCSATTQSYFSGQIKAANDNAYYRADFPANNFFQGAVSGSIHAWRYQTKITNYNVSPHLVNGGQTVTITGKLWHRTGTKWVLYGRKKVEILYNQKGTSYWSPLGTVTTSSKGAFREVANVAKANFVVIIYADYAGSSVDLADRTAGVTVTVRLRSAALAFNLASGQVPVMLATAGTERTTLARHESLMLTDKSSKKARTIL
jgi:hypothetical protein